MIQAGDTRRDRRPVRHDRRAAARPQPGHRPGGADGRPADPRQVESAPREAACPPLGDRRDAGPGRRRGRGPVDAEAFVVQNAGTGEVLAAGDEREHLPMASITKLMTAIVALERLARRRRHGLAADGRSRRVDDQPPSRRARDAAGLIRAALIQSANDAANAIAAFVGRGSVGRFVELMNARAPAGAERHALHESRRPRRARPLLERRGRRSWRASR